ncbi:pyridoxamine 5'-phosphate oxidase [Nocardioides currus]|uniref:Pyridoxamine 5'-phosphate oxidase n=2 Tax=Nocardioides currus TaxID=2133958 RepID=A0A2R7YSH3_9ACTN|nr:pyridoxamine 5'-phosphate oxidase [Nocardioides currus]
MKDTRIAILTYRSASGDLVSTPMGTQDFEDPSTVWFITEVTSDKAAAITSDPRVNVSYSSDLGWVSLAGTARVNMDRDKLKELWDASAGIFMSGGPDDAENGLLEITGTTAEYWESPGKVATVVQLAKGLVTDGEPDLGDSGVVQL